MAGKSGQIVLRVARNPAAAGIWIRARRDPRRANPRAAHHPRHHRRQQPNRRNPELEIHARLRDPVTRDVQRGAIFLYKDLHERAIPVEVVLPAEFLTRASTNPDDITARRSLTLD